MGVWASISAATLKNWLKLGDMVTSAVVVVETAAVVAEKKISCWEELSEKCLPTKKNVKATKRKKNAILRKSPLLEIEAFMMNPNDIVSMKRKGRKCDMKVMIRVTD